MVYWFRTKELLSFFDPSQKGIYKISKWLGCIISHLISLSLVYGFGATTTSRARSVMISLRYGIIFLAKNKLIGPYSSENECVTGPSYKEHFDSTCFDDFETIRTTWYFNRMVPFFIIPLLYGIPSTKSLQNADMRLYARFLGLHALCIWMRATPFCRDVWSILCSVDSHYYWRTKRNVKQVVPTNDEMRLKPSTKHAK